MFSGNLHEVVEFFAEFADEWKFTHVTSSPHHPKGNGFAESMVKVVKQTLQHAKYSGDPFHGCRSHQQCQ